MKENAGPLQAFCSSATEAVEFIAKHGADRNVYAGMATRKGGKGDAEHLATLRALWLDFDFDAQNFDGDLETLRMALEDFPFKPSMWVHSGGGVHLYWLLDEPVSLETPEARRLLHCVERGMCDVLKADHRAVDPARIMRVPGTINWPDDKKRKLGRKKAPSFIDRHFTQHLLDFTDFADYFELRGAALLEQPAPKEFDSTPFDGELPDSVKRLTEKVPAKFSAKAQASWTLLATRWANEGEGLGDSSASGIDQAVANLLVMFDIPIQEVEHALRWRRWKLELGHKWAGYYHGTCANALAWNEARKEERASESQQRAEALAAAVDQETLPMIESPLEDYTEDGLAIRLIREQGHRLKYCAEEGYWYVYTGAQWLRDTTQKTLHSTRKQIQAIYHDVADAEDEKERARLENQAKQSRRLNTMKAVVGIAGTDPKVAIDLNHFDTHANCLNVANGFLNLDTGNLEPHSPSQLATHLVPFDYNPTAECPLWEKYLSEAQPDPEVVKFLQRVAGYCLSASTSEEAVFFNVGGGANGKSTMIETMAHIMGEYAIAMPTKTILVENLDSIPNDVAKLPGRRFATIMETDAGKKLSEARIKSLASGERMPARHLFKDWFEFNPVAKFMMASNHKPEVKGTDDGIWRRIVLIDWPVRFSDEEQDKNLKEKLRAEGEGILAWMVRGYSMWKAQGLDIPQPVVQATAEYRTDEDVIGEFIKERCVVDLGNASLKMTNKRMRGGYDEWCKENGYEAASPKKLGAYLEARGFTQTRHRTLGRMRQGIDLKEPVEGA